MPVTFDNAAVAQTSGLVVSVALTAAANATLLTFISTNLGLSVSAIYANATPLTRLVRIGNLMVYALTAAPSGVISLSAVMQTAGTFAMIGMTYKGVKASGGFGTVAADTASSVATANLSVSASSTALVVAGFHAGSSVVVGFNNGTTRASVSASSGAVHLMAADITGNTSITLSATAAAGLPAWYMAAVPLYFSAGAALYTGCLTGCGK